jgi:hypothetical protein
MVEHISPLHLEDHLDDAPAVFSNPGWLYNIGNLLALLGALLLFVLLAGSTLSFVGLAAHFLGNWPAVLTTAASLIFWISGMYYAKAWAGGFPPHARSTAIGHGLSTLGALTIGVALMGLAHTEVSLALAIIATILHAGGKLASWRAPQSDTYFKAMPLYSRVPYFTTLCLDMRSDILAGAPLGATLIGLVLPLFLAMATLFWARADWILLQKSAE